MSKASFNDSKIATGGSLTYITAWDLKARDKGMRWHLIGGILVGLLGLIFLAGGVVVFIIMLYYNLKYGPIEFSNGEREALDQIALTWRNALFCGSTLLAGMTGCSAALAWFKVKSRLATILTAVFFLFFGLAGILAQGR